jgi:predicted ArsR family transcriptional regulator
VAGPLTLTLSMVGKSITMVRYKHIKKTSVLREKRLMARKPSATKLQHEREVLSVLQKGHATMKAIEQETGLNYYTVRRQCEDLQKRGIINVVDYIERNRVYAYNVDPTKADTIPRFTDVVNQRTVKYIFAISAVGDEDGMAAVKAMKRLPAHVVNLFIAANHAHHGQDVEFRLDRLREALQRDMLLIKNAESMIEQILTEPRFWEPEYLAKMVDDPDYNFVALTQAKELLEEREEDGQGQVR